MSGREIATNGTAVLAEVLLTAVVYALLRRYAPARDPGVDPLMFERLRDRYCWVEPVGLVPMLACGVALTWALYQALGAVGAWVAAVRREPAEFVIDPGPRAMLLPALFLALVLNVFPMALFVRVLLGRDGYREFGIVSRYGLGFDAARVFSLIAAIFVPASLGLAGLLMDQYALATRSHLVVNRFWGLTEHRRAYTEVVAVYAADGSGTPDGKKGWPPHHAIRFRDGSTWMTREGLRDPRPAQDEPMVRYVAERAGVSVQRVASLPE